MRKNEVLSFDLLVSIMTVVLKHVSSCEMFTFCDVLHDSRDNRDNQDNRDRICAGLCRKYAAIVKKLQKICRTEYMQAQGAYQKLLNTIP